MAVGRSRVVRIRTGEHSGTGFLVASHLLVTAWHVVADLIDGKAEGAELFYGGSSGPLDQPDEWLDAITVVAGDAVEDWIVLRVDGLPGQHVWPLAKAHDADCGRAWSTFGFHSEDGDEASGTLETVDAPRIHDGRGGRRRLASLQLFSKQAAAGNGQPKRGYSGGPVVIDGHVVGVLVSAARAKRSAEPSDDRPPTVRGGTVYARPIEMIAEALGIPLENLSAVSVPSSVPTIQVFDAPETQPLFAGHTELLEQLAEHLSKPKPRVVALVGMAGVGKSFLVHRFAQLHRAKFPVMVRVALQLGEHRTEQLLGELADQLGVSSTQVAEQLRVRRVLVLLENADDSSSASAAQELVKRLDGCAVIVTGRHRELGRREGWERVEISALDRDDTLAPLAHDDAERAAYERLALIASTSVADLEVGPECDVFKLGDPAEFFYLLIEGELEEYVESPTGGLRVLRTYQAPDCFGELGLPDGKPRETTVRATAAGARMLVLDREAFRNVSRNSDRQAGLATVSGSSLALSLVTRSLQGGRTADLAERLEQALDVWPTELPDDDGERLKEVLETSTGLSMEVPGTDERSGPSDHHRGWRAGSVPPVQAESGTEELERVGEALRRDAPPSPEATDAEPRSPLRVFISYSHDSDEHRRRVLELTQQLRMDGIDAWLDLFEPAPPQGWPRWMSEQIQRADFVVLVCTENYRRRFEGYDTPSFEGLLATQLLYERTLDHERIVPVMFAGADQNVIPLAVRASTFHMLPKQYDELCRRLTRQLAVAPAPLGRLTPVSLGFSASNTAEIGETRDAGIEASPGMGDGPTPKTQVHVEPLRAGSGSEEIWFGEGEASLETDEEGNLTETGAKSKATEVDAIPGEEDWELKLHARMSKSAAKGPIYIEFYQTVQGKEYIVYRHEDMDYDGSPLYTTVITLEDNIGFNKDREYRVQIVQNNGKKDIVMARGKVKLINTGRKAEREEREEGEDSPDASNVRWGDRWGARWNSRSGYPDGSDVGRQAWKFPAGLLNARDRQTLIPFVGAGVSMTVRHNNGARAFPSWLELLKNAAERLSREHRAEAHVVQALLNLPSPDTLEATRHAARGLGSLWSQFLRENLDIPRSEVDDESMALAKAVWTIGSQLVLTTNYDRVLRWSCPDSSDLTEWQIAATPGLTEAMRGALSRPTLWHLRGSISDPSKLVLSPDDYAQLYSSKETQHRDALKTLRNLVTARHLFFIGFSLEDPYAARELQWVRDALRGCGGPHYMLVRQRDVAGMAPLVDGIDIQFVCVDEFEQMPDLLRSLQFRLAGMPDRQRPSRRGAAAPRHAQPAGEVENSSEARAQATISDLPVDTRAGIDTSVTGEGFNDRPSSFKDGSPVERLTATLSRLPHTYNCLRGDSDMSEEDLARALFTAASPLALTRIFVDAMQRAAQAHDKKVAEQLMKLFCSLAPVVAERCSLLRDTGEDYQTVSVVHPQAAEPSMAAEFKRTIEFGDQMDEGFILPARYIPSEREEIPESGAGMDTVVETVRGDRLRRDEAALLTLEKLATRFEMSLTGSLDDRLFALDARLSEDPGSRGHYTLVHGAEQPRQREFIQLLRAAGLRVLAPSSDIDRETKRESFQLRQALHSLYHLYRDIVAGASHETT